MTIMGQGLIAIWNDIEDAVREEFYEWHEREHMPERVGIPGFVRGRRLRRVDAEVEYLTLYEAESADVLAGKDYLDRLNDPTDWTRRVVPGFQNVTRALTGIVRSEAIGNGGAVLALALTIPDAVRDATRRRFGGDLFDELGAAGGVCGVHYAETDVAASSVETVERQQRKTANAVPDAILILEASRPERLERCRRLIDAAVDDCGVAYMRPPGTYRLEFELLKA